MKKVNILNSFLYLFVKYIIFFFILALMEDRFKNAVINNAETSMELFKLTLGYILTVLIYSLPLIFVFTFPIHYILGMKKSGRFILSLLLLFVIEYLVYTYFYSPSDSVLGGYNFIVGIVVLWVFFRKSIKEKFARVA